jgi:hypothetical protein
VYVNSFSLNVFLFNFLFSRNLALRTYGIRFCRYGYQRGIQKPETLSTFTNTYRFDKHQLFYVYENAYNVLVMNTFYLQLYLTTYKLKLINWVYFMFSYLDTYFRHFL